MASSEEANIRALRAMAQSRKGIQVKGVGTSIQHALALLVVKVAEAGA